MPVIDIGNGDFYQIGYGSQGRPGGKRGRRI